MNSRYLLLALLLPPSVGCGQTNGNSHDGAEGSEGTREGTADGTAIASDSGGNGTLGGSSGTSGPTTGTGGATGNSTGSDGADSGATTTGGETSGGGGSGTEGGGGGGAPPEGTGGGTGGDGGGRGDPDCRGEFGEPELLFYDENERVESLAPTGDELELFYVRTDGSGNSRRIALRARTSLAQTFGDASFPQQLGDVCGSDQVGSVDVSEDGLSLYIACAQQDLQEPATLRVATRTARAGEFVVSAQSFGSVWHSISISTDQLSLYAQPASGGAPVIYDRGSTSDPFAEGVAVDIPGWLGNPDVNHSGLELYGTVTDEATNLPQLVVAQRPSTEAPFSAPTDAGLPDLSAASPAISADCRALYFVNIVASAGNVAYLAEVARR